MDAPILSILVPGMRIERIDCTPIEYPFHGYFKFIGPRSVRAAILVEITADDGTQGFGQSVPVATWSHETVATSLAVLRENFGPALVGIDPLDLPAAQQSLDRALASSFSTPMPIARAGLDLALHDLAGKLERKSLAELWGRPPGGGIELSWTINVLSLDRLEDELVAGQARGYRNFNIKIGGGDERFDIELARRVRKFAPHGFLWADANCGYTPATALEIAPKLADAGVEALESPLPANHIAGYQALCRQRALPIVMDEGVVSPVDAEEFLRLGMFDGLAIKIARAGGLESARRQIERVLEGGRFWLGSGLSDPDLSLAASLALFSAYRLEKPAALNGPQFLRDTVLAEPLRIEGDRAEAPRGPGLGVRVDRAKLAGLAPR